MVEASTASLFLTPTGLARRSRFNPFTTDRLGQAQGKLEKFWSGFSISSLSDCWIWTHSKNNYGYGKVLVSKKVIYTHRLAYSLLRGDIPPGLVLDHLCRTVACGNPFHLEAVTNKENGRRGKKGVLTTHCPHGHDYTIENTYLDGVGKRHCRQCHKEAYGNRSR